ncbi:MAG: hypothetical protein WC637_19555 [Victivallales bacterium]|jgi:hypothetical protein
MKIRIPINNENWFKSAIAVIALILLFTGVWAYVRTSPGVDFYISWMGVMSVREQKCVNFYDTEKGVQLRETFYKRSLEKAVPQRQKVVAQCWQDYEKIFYKARTPDNRLLFFFNTPFLYTCLQLFVGGDYERDISLFYLVQLLSFMFFIIIVMHLLNFSFTSILYPAMLFSVFFGPFLCDIRVGNVVLLQLAFLALYLACTHLIRKRDIGQMTGGVALGLMVFFKPTMIFVPFMLLVGWLALKQYRQAALSFMGMAAGSLFAVLSASLFFSTFRVWFWWFNSACDISSLPYVTVGEGNFALSRVLGEFCGLQKLSFIFLALLLAVIISIAVSIGKKDLTKTQGMTESHCPDNLLMISIGCLICLICSPLVWIHYYMLALPALMYLARPILAMRGARQTIIYSLAILSYCFICVTGRSDVTGLSLTASAILSNIGVICLLSCLIWIWRSGCSNKSAPLEI